MVCGIGGRDLPRKKAGNVIGPHEPALFQASSEIRQVGIGIGGKGRHTGKIT
jgi:hypothetical protein